MEGRLPAHLEISGLIRAVEAAGGFAMVIAKGERDAGTILVTCCENGENLRIFERLPHPDGTRQWTRIQPQYTDNKEDISRYLGRRHDQDPDLWILELDVANGERFIGLDPEKG